MKTDWIPGVVLFIGVTLLTVLFWYKVSRKEGFNNVVLSQILENATEQKEEKPISSTQAAIYYRALLVYISNDFSDGLKLVYDLNKRVFGKTERAPPDFDPRRILDNYKNPIAGI